MTTDHIDRLNELADAIVAEFDQYRPSADFRAISPVVETSNRDRPTLIVHVDHEDAASVADEIEAFLTARSVTTEREQHGPEDVRVLGTVD